MNRLRNRRPSASLVIAVLALIVAVGGGGQAFADAGARISALISGKSIKKGTITGNKLKKNTLTGTQIKESALGKVPSATSADTASSAASATNAGHATSADSATTATSIDGTITKAFSFKGVASESQVILDTAGYTVTASCSGTTEPVLFVKNNSAVNGEIQTETQTSIGTDGSDIEWLFTPGTSFDVIGAPPHGLATFASARLDGAALTGQVIFDNPSSFGGDYNGCHVSGSLVVKG